MSFMNKSHIRTADECITCMSNMPNVIFIPCGHQAVCSDCYGEYRINSNECLLCRRIITGSYQIGLLTPTQQGGRRQYPQHKRYTKLSHSLLHL